MKTKLTIAILTCSVSLLTLPCVHAQNTVPPTTGDTQTTGSACTTGGAGKHQHGDRKGSGQRMEALTKELSLTADQQAKIKAIFEETRPQMKALRDDTTLAPKERHAKMKVIRDANQTKIRAVLSTEQATKFDEFLAKEKAKHGKHGQHN